MTKDPRGRAEDRVPCRVCGEPALRARLSGRERFLAMRGSPAADRNTAVAWCRACRCGTTQLVPDAPFLAAVYSEAYFREILGVGDARDRADQLRIVEESVVHLDGARVLEIGCSTGDLLLLLRARGGFVSGVESAPFARSLAVARGLDVWPSLAEVPPGAFDLVVLFDVLEHLPEPVSEMRWVRARLAPGGRVLVGVPNIDSLESRLLGRRWFGLELPRHLTHLSPTALGRLGRRVGLVVRRVDRGPQSFFAKSLVDARLADRWAIRPRLLQRALVAALWLGELALRALGDRPYLVAVMDAAPALEGAS